MAKELSICNICGQRRLVNFAGLCKRCGKSKKGVAFYNKAIAKHQEELETTAELQEDTQEALTELHALEEKEELTSEEKERLEELRQETKNVASQDEKEDVEEKTSSEDKSSSEDK
ncbi:MAG: hypothetical protein ACQESC_02320 [Nanobdellota archaeon]